MRQGIISLLIEQVEYLYIGHHCEQYSGISIIRANTKGLEESVCNTVADHIRIIQTPRDHGPRERCL